MGHPPLRAQIHSADPGADFNLGRQREWQRGPVHDPGTGDPEHGVSEVLMSADRPQSGPNRRAGSRHSEKGVAMIIAVIAIAVLTAVATEFVYNSRVDLQLATN